jgi:hypothetical protein
MNNQFDELTKSLAQSVTRRAALKKFGFGLAGMALTCFALANQLNAGTPTFTRIDFPASVFTLAAGINSSGDIVGRYADAAGVNHGFLLSGGTFTSLDIPGAEFTRPVCINDYGDIVGHYDLLGTGKDHGFLLRGGVYTTIDSRAARKLSPEASITTVKSPAIIGTPGTGGMALYLGAARSQRSTTLEPNTPKSGG